MRAERDADSGNQYKQDASVIPNDVEQHRRILADKAEELKIKYRMDQNDAQDEQASKRVQLPDSVFCNSHKITHVIIP